MTTLFIDGNLPDTLPAREDGTPYPFAAAWEDAAVFTDTRTELTAALIPGYEDIPEGPDQAADSLYARYESAVAIANNRQAVLAAIAQEEGTFDPSLETEDTLTALFTPKDQKIDEINQWDHEYVPLVLVASGYAPYTATQQPTGNVQWIDPYTETTFLDSLAAIGMLELFVNENP